MGGLAITVGHQSEHLYIHDNLIMTCTHRYLNSLSFSHRRFQMGQGGFDGCVALVEAAHCADNGCYLWPGASCTHGRVIVICHRNVHTDDHVLPVILGVR